MTNMQAAIGLIQLNHVNDWVAKRNDNAAKIINALSASPLFRVPVPGNDIYHAYYKLYAFVSEDALADGWNRDRIISEIVNFGVPCFSGTCPEVYLEGSFAGSDYVPDQRLPVAKSLGETSLMFLVHPTLSDAEIEKTCRIISEVSSMRN